MNYLLLLSEEAEASRFCSNFTPIWTIMGYIIFAIKVIVPILLIITGMVTFLKAVIKEGKEASESLDLLKKKALYAVVVFLVVQLVGIVMQFVSKESFFEKCAKCAFSPFNEANNCYIMKKTGYSRIEYPSSTTDTTNSTSTTAKSKEDIIRKAIIDAGEAAIKTKDSDFIYLDPGERNDTGCLEKFFYGQKCTTKDKKSCSGSSCTHYGTDCNGFVGYVYHQALGIENSSNYRFAYHVGTAHEWETLGTAGNYFKKVKVIQDGYNNTSIIEEYAKPGDMLGRSCYDGQEYHNHIGIYAGNGQVIDNNGHTSHPILSKRSLKDFVSHENIKCNVTVLQLYNYDIEAYPNLKYN